jgi:exopolyphosphatase/guanosine-5'-triphosphate,3'-diphosphate pyrophosphatase
VKLNAILRLFEVIDHMEPIEKHNREETMAHSSGPIPVRVPGPTHPGIEEIRQWMESVDPEPEHELQVTRLAVMLFDQLEPLHGMSQDERNILEAASMVHDIGMTIAGKKHHKNSREMVQNHRFLMWRPEEIDLISLVARYHRKAEPSMKHPEFAVLAQQQRTVVRKLAGILRLADGLDRAHLSTVQSIEVSWDSATIWIKLHTYRDCGTEIWGAERKSSLFESVFGRRLTLQAVDGYSVDKS